jgi:adenylate kinase
VIGSPQWIVFIGPPGVGKGTQCRRLTQELLIPHLSTGDRLRETKGVSVLGQMVADYIDRGRLAPDDLVMRLVTERIEQPEYSNGCLFDGFPRTVPQAEMLDCYLASKGTEVTVVVQLQGERSQLLHRIIERGRREGRADDNQVTVNERLEVFDRQTAPVLDHYKQAGLVRSIDAMQTPEEVFAAILSSIKSSQGLDHQQG